MVRAKGNAGHGARAHRAEFLGARNRLRREAQGVHHLLGVDDSREISRDRRLVRERIQSPDVFHDDEGFRDLRADETFLRSRLQRDRRDVSPTRNGAIISSSRTRRAIRRRNTCRSRARPRTAGTVREARRRHSRRPGLWVEGPTAIKVGDDYVVYYDAYHDEALWRAALARLENVGRRHREDEFPDEGTPVRMRHGTILPVPLDVVARLTKVVLPEPK